MNATNASLAQLERERLLQAIEKGRLPHALLLKGEDLRALEDFALDLGRYILKTEKPSSHPDCFILRPGNKMRQINIASVRELIRDLNKTSSQSGAKLALICEADCMHASSANAFLKVLEEPPSGTYLILMSARAENMLATILSRTVPVIIPGSAPPIEHSDWTDWLTRYTHYLQDCFNAASNPISNRLMTLYGLIDRFTHCLDELTQMHWESHKNGLDTEHMEEEALLAIEAGERKALRNHLFTAIAQRTYQACDPLLAQSPKLRSMLCEALTKFMDSLRLLAYNMNEAALLEDYLLELNAIGIRHTGLD